MLTKFQKVIVLFSAAWGIVALLIAGGLSTDSYTERFSVVTFLAISLITCLPIILYWAGVWIWGFGCILKSFKFLFAFVTFKKTRNSIKTQEEAEGIIRRAGNAFIFFGFLSVFAALSDLGGSKSNFTSGLLAGAIFAVPGLYIKSRQSPPAAIAMALISAFYAIVGIALLAETKDIFWFAAVFLILGAFGYYKSMRTYQAARLLRENQFSVSNIPRKVIAPPFEWKIKTLLFFFWTIPPLYLAWAIYSFSAEGIGAVFGAYMVISFIASALVRENVKKRKKEYRPSDAFLAILLAAIVQFSMNFDKWEDARDAKEFERELKGATASNYWDIIKSSSTKLGRALSSARDIGFRSTEKNSKLIQDIDCALPICEKLLDNSTLVSNSKRREALAEIEPRLQIAISADSKIDDIQQDANRQFEKLTSISANTKSEIMEGFHKTQNKILPLEKNFLQSYKEVYENLVTLYGFLDQKASYYSLNKEGKILFSDQSVLDEYTKYRSAVIASVNQMVENKKIMVDSENAIAANSLKEMGLH